MPPLAVHFVSLIILVALAFDFINGFHDAANSIATVVSTRVLSPRVAVVWAAFFNFVAAFGLGVHVATTIGKGVVDPAAMTNLVVVAALAGAIVWDLITWYYGLPVSSSHALIGGLVGAALAAAGARVLVWSGIQKIVIFIVLSPVVGMLLGFLFMVAVMWIARNATPMRVDRVFLAAHAAIAAGTLAGGWRIVKTMGMRITKLQPVGGFCAEAAAAISILGASFGGVPVSTTHTISGAIMGVGATRRLSAVRWGVATRIVWAWILTIPASALVATLTYWGLASFFR